MTIHERLQYRVVKVTCVYHFVLLVLVVLEVSEVMLSESRYFVFMSKHFV